MPTSPVLIVGAGPVGLATALFLDLAGVRVRLVDANDGPTALSKALVLWRRSLLTLDPVVPTEQFTAVGTEMRGARFHDQGALVTRLEFEAAGHALPGGLLLPQSRIEQILIEALAGRGIAVERNSRLTGFSQESKSVHCTLEGPRGKESIETPYLIGCDGAHSTVRHTLGVDFPGEAVAGRWWLGDVDVEVMPGSNPNSPENPAEEDLDPGWIYINSSAEGAMVVLPIQPGRYRLMVSGGDAGPETPRQDPTVAELESALHRRTRLQWRLAGASWLADFRVNERQVEHYVHGRVLLAGDAAHVHSPAGGQGMNTGIQDAANLAWKVALSVSQHAGPELLSSYQEERHPVAAGVLQMSGRMLRSASITRPFIRHVRDLAMAVALHLPAVRHLAADALTEDDIRYLDSPLNGEGTTLGACTPGEFFPDVPVEIDGCPSPSISLLRGKSGTLGTLVLGEAADLAAWPTHFGGRPLSVMQLGKQFRDPARLLQDRWGWGPSDGVLVRPDGVIAAAGEPSTAWNWLSRHTVA